MFCDGACSRSAILVVVVGSREDVCRESEAIDDGGSSEMAAENRIFRDVKRPRLHPPSALFMSALDRTLNHFPHARSCRPFFWSRTLPLILLNIWSSP